MQGLILTGPLGVGKSTAQRRLVRDHDFWSPVDVTTRPVERKEAEAINCSPEEFERMVLDGGLVFPTFFAGAWYAWRRNDLQRLVHGEGLAVLNVRPHTALTLGALFAELQPVWLWIEKAVLADRRRKRNESRDLDRGLRAARERADAYDCRFERLFACRVRADESAVPNLLAILGDETSV